MEEEKYSEYTANVYESNKQPTQNAREAVSGYSEQHKKLFETEGDVLQNLLKQEGQQSESPAEQVKNDAEVRSRAAKLTDDIATRVQENFMDIMFGRYKEAPSFKSLIEDADVDAENLLKILIAFEKPQAQLHEVVTNPDSDIAKKYSEFMKPAQQKQLNEVLTGLVNDIKTLYTDEDIELVSSKITSLFSHIEKGEITGQ
tara:strand:+ start:1241 stop:1843 length:603 start_codon:yes stop_codon:yes gene_type:complete